MFIPDRKYLASLLLVLFSFYYANITFFPHSHILGDQVITHSHFYGGITTSAHPAHSHSDSSLAIINDLSLFLALALALGTVLFALEQTYRRSYIVLAIVPRSQQLEQNIQLRAPPASC